MYVGITAFLYVFLSAQDNQRLSPVRGLVGCFYGLANGRAWDFSTRPSGGTLALRLRRLHMPFQRGVFEILALAVAG